MLVAVVVVQHQVQIKVVQKLVGMVAVATVK
jgi:hypothetical protein